jgi:septal ring factor EnvC (AmiA/AmiB activator)
MITGAMTLVGIGFGAGNVLGRSPLEEKIGNFDRRVSTLEARMVTLDASVQAVERNISAINTNLEWLRGTLTKQQEREQHGAPR